MKKESNARKFSETSFFIVFAYFIVGSLWIVFSDQILALFIADSRMLTTMQTWKGWFFILVTSFLLYLLVKRNLRKNIAKSIEEMEEMSAQERQSEKMRALGQLAGGIAHDFNNQLSAIIGFSDILMLNEEIEKKHRTMINSIMICAKNAARLTSQLLEFSRKDPVSFSDVEVNKIVKNVIEISSRTFGKGLTVKSDICNTSLFTTGNSSQIHNAILNLAINARDSLSKGGSISITLTKQHLDSVKIKTLHVNNVEVGDYIVISVSDTGSGISEENFEKIFEPFYTTKDNGTGMGLSTVYGCAINHKGALSVESRLGEGSCFTLYLPFKKIYAQAV